MSSETEKQKSAEGVVERLLALDELQLKSMAVIHDVAAGYIVGMSMEGEDGEWELASGVTYVVIGLGRVLTDYASGVTDVAINKQRRNSNG